MLPVQTDTFEKGKMWPGQVAVLLGTGCLLFAIFDLFGESVMIQSSQNIYTGRPQDQNSQALLYDLCMFWLSA